MPPKHVVVSLCLDPRARSHPLRLLLLIEMFPFNEHIILPLEEVFPTTLDDFDDFMDI